MKNRTVILIVIGGFFVIVVLVSAFLIKDLYFDTGTQIQEVKSELGRVLIEAKDLKTYENFDGTLKYEDDVRIVAQQEGVLTYLAPE